MLLYPRLLMSGYSWGSIVFRPGEEPEKLAPSPFLRVGPGTPWLASLGPETFRRHMKPTRIIA
jgi:hypothetical protein